MSIKPLSRQTAEEVVRSWKNDGRPKPPCWDDGSCPQPIRCYLEARCLKGEPWPHRKPPQPPQG